MPLDPLARPTKEDFDAHVKYLEMTWHDALEAKKTADAYYFQSVNIWEDYYTRFPAAPQDRPNFHSGRSFSLIDHAVDAHLAFQPVFHRIPAGKGQGHKDAADCLEKGLQAVFEDAFKKAPQFPTKQNGKQLVLHYHTWLGVLLDVETSQKPAQKPGEDKEDFDRREWEWRAYRQHWNPISLYVPDVGEILANPLESVPRIAIRNRKIRAFELADLTRVKEEKFRRSRDSRYATAFAMPYEIGTKDPYQEIETEEWWTVRWVALRLKGGEMLTVEPNTWGIQPWAQKWGGSGIMRAGEGFNPQWWVRQAIMFRVMESLKILWQSQAGQHNLLSRAAWARMGFVGDAAEAAEQLQGRIMTGNEDDWWVEKVPSLPGQVFQQEQNLTQGIEADTYALQAAGFRQSGVDTATQQIILSEASSRTFKPAVEALADLYSIQASNAMKLLYRLNKEYGEKYAAIGIGENKLAVKDMYEQFHVEARFEQVDQVAYQAAVQLAMALYDKGLVDKEYVWRAARIEDVAALREGIFKDMLDQHPEVIEKGVITAMREEGLHELADRREGVLKSRLQQMRNAEGNGAGP